MSQAAFTLRAEFEGDSFAGSVSLPDGGTFNVGDELAKGKGTIVTDDPHVILALDTYPALKHTTVPDKARVKSTPDKASDPGTSGAGNEPTKEGGDS